MKIKYRIKDNLLSIVFIVIPIISLFFIFSNIYVNQNKDAWSKSQTKLIFKEITESLKSRIDTLKRLEGDEKITSLANVKESVKAAEFEYFTTKNYVESDNVKFMTAYYLNQWLTSTEGSEKWNEKKMRVKSPKDYFGNRWNELKKTYNIPDYEIKGGKYLLVYNDKDTSGINASKTLYYMQIEKNMGNINSELSSGVYSIWVNIVQKYLIGLVAIMAFVAGLFNFRRQNDLGVLKTLSSKNHNRVKILHKIMQSDLLTILILNFSSLITTSLILFIKNGKESLFYPVAVNKSSFISFFANNKFYEFSKDATKRLNFGSTSLVNHPDQNKFFDEFMTLPIWKILSILAVVSFLVIVLFYLIGILIALVSRSELKFLISLALLSSLIIVPTIIKELQDTVIDVRTIFNPISVLTTHTRTTIIQVILLIVTAITIIYLCIKKIFVRYEI